MFALHIVGLEKLTRCGGSPSHMDRLLLVCVLKPRGDVASVGNCVCGVPSGQFTAAGHPDATSRDLRPFKHTDKRILARGYGGDTYQKTFEHTNFGAAHDQA